MDLSSYWDNKLIEVCYFQTLTTVTQWASCVITVAPDVNFHLKICISNQLRRYKYWIIISSELCHLNSFGNPCNVFLVRMKILKPLRLLLHKWCSFLVQTGHGFTVYTQYMFHKLLYTNTIQVSQLGRDQRYVFRIFAENRFGRSEPAVSRSVVVRYPFKRPGPPSEPEIVRSTRDSVELTWREPANDGGTQWNGKECLCDE